MNLILDYPDTATFIEATSSAGYANKKTVANQFDCSVIFIQSIDFIHNNFQDNLDADAVCFPDPTNTDILATFNRLEGVYVLMALFGADAARSWFKITKVTVNRDHLLNNEIDNIHLLLKKTEPIPGIS